MSVIGKIARFIGIGGGASPGPSTHREAVGATIDDDEDQWRKLSGDGRRDLAPVTQRRMRELAVYVWEANLLANRLIELPIAYLLAEGVALKSDDEGAQEWLDAFWNDPINAMDLSLPRKMRLLGLMGEVCWPVFVNEMSGHVRLGTLDPSQIETVVFDPDNAEQPIGIVTVRGKKGTQRRYRVIVIGPENVFGPRARTIRESFTDGDCFYFRINDLGSRGRSDLLAQIDWLDAYEQFMFGEIDRSQFQRAFMWDVTLKGATADEVKQRAREITAPRPNSVRVHNDSEEWNTESPTLNAEDSSNAARLFRNHVLGGATLPEHWYGGGGDVNRATASEMGDPTYKVLAMRQQVWSHILEAVGSYVIWRRLDPAGEDSPDSVVQDAAFKPKAIFPELVNHDVSKYATAMASVVAAAAMAVDRGLMSSELALTHIQSISARLGVEFDVAEALKDALAEQQERRQRQAHEDSFRDLPLDETSEDEATQAATGGQAARPEE